MKIILLALILIISSCTKKVTTTEDKNAIVDTTLSNVPVKDIQVQIDENYFEEYPEDIVKLYDKWFNEINEPYVLSPKIAFEKLQDNFTGEYSFLRNQFTSEVGEDGFYLLYSYFLQQKIGTEKFKDERKNVIQIFTLINNLNKQLQYGGTFFAHQNSRIYGDAEYAIYRYADNEWLVKQYSVEKQKKYSLMVYANELLTRKKMILKLWVKQRSNVGKNYFEC